MDYESSGTRSFQLSSHMQLTSLLLNFEKNVIVIPFFERAQLQQCDSSILSRGVAGVCDVSATQRDQSWNPQKHCGGAPQRSSRPGI
jgi:hypothetical protein